MQSRPVLALTIDMMVMAYDVPVQVPNADAKSCKAVNPDAGVEVQDNCQDREFGISKQASCCCLAHLK